MDAISLLVGVMFGCCVGGGAVWFLFSQRLSLMQQTKQDMENAFKALSADVLQSNNATFLDLAKTTLEKYQSEAKSDLSNRQQAIQHLVTPIRESLDKVDQKIGLLEQERVGAYHGLKAQVQSLLEAQQALRAETLNLSNALKSPVTRGRWGEIQLKRVVEMAGMMKHCDFVEQEVASSESGKQLRPDMVVKLPGQKNIIVDAKAPLKAYLEAMETTDETARQQFLKDHARQVKVHIQSLAQKSYWDQFQPSPEFVVLFLPGENFFSAALEYDPGLIELGVEHRVILATPTTLISLLRSVAYGWRQEAMADNVREVQKLGRELHGRVADLLGHFSDVAKHLKNTVGSFNKAVGTLETRVLVSARRFEELKVDDAKKSIGEAPLVDLEPRPITAAMPALPEADF